jgi:hypothetical protein
MKKQYDDRMKYDENFFLLETAKKIDEVLQPYMDDILDYRAWRDHLNRFHSRSRIHENMHINFTMFKFNFYPDRSIPDHYCLTLEYKGKRFAYRIVRDILDDEYATKALLEEITDELDKWRRCKDSQSTSIHHV